MKDNPCVRFAYIGSDGNPVYKSKKVFVSDKEAIEFAKQMNKRNIYHLIHKQIAYKCDKCGCWHVGRSKVSISDKNRIKIMNS